jgi:hypothetical protein
VREFTKFISGMLGGDVHYCPHYNGLLSSILLPELARESFEVLIIIRFPYKVLDNRP